MKLLLTNDDGIFADGLAVLASRLAGLGEVSVVAPDRERSCTGHAFTLHEPLRVERLRANWFSVSGTPADCVYLGALELCPKPDLVISGINHGYNLGTDIFYSGTVAGAVEAALRGIPAIAVSMGTGAGADFTVAAALCQALVVTTRSLSWPRGVVLNINVPGPEHLPSGARCASMAWTNLGRYNYREQVEVRQNPRGQTYYWIGGPPLPNRDPPGTDADAVHRGIASVTPLSLDLTHVEFLAELRERDVGGFARVRA